MMASIWPKIWDLTYAHSAMFTGAGFNHGLQNLFLDSLIEDLWIPYFCISTDIRLVKVRSALNFFCFLACRKVPNCNFEI